VDMAKGLVHPDVNGRYRIGHVQSGGKKSDESQIKMVNLNLKYARRQWVPMMKKTHFLINYGY
jgi:hypothetical protein